MNKASKQKLVFSFWKDNQVSGYFELTEEQLKDRFKEFLSKKDKEWIAYYSSHEIVANFLTSKEGLSSVGDQDQFDSMRMLLKPVIYDKA